MAAQLGSSFEDSSHCDGKESSKPAQYYCTVCIHCIVDNSVLAFLLQGCWRKCFKTNSLVATTTLRLVKDVKTRSDENKDAFQKFSRELILEMEKVVFIGTVRKRNSIINRDKLWRNYFLHRSSKQFIERWENFLSLVPTEIKGVCALLYQRVTDIIFKVLTGAFPDI